MLDSHRTRRRYKTVEFRRVGVGGVNWALNVATRMWANAQRDGRPSEYRWRPLLKATKFGCRRLLECRV